ncbi:MAG: M55 family metallopeptidase [Planctomycetota bacterium]
MNILIMADMEGVSGIVKWDQVDYTGPQYQEGRRLYTEELNAAVRGAFAGGATRVVAVDCHGAGGDGSFNSWMPELLDERVEWVAGHPWGRYTDILETGCDMALMIGMHARAGTPDGVLCHTISTTTWDRVRFNDDEVGEFGINAALCGLYGVPVTLITGDAATIREGRELLGDGLHGVVVKKGLSRYSACQIAPKKARQMIEDGAKLAVSSPVKTEPYVPAAPTTITIDLSTVDTANRFMGRSGVELTGPLQAVSKAKDWQTAWDQVWHW